MTQVKVYTSDKGRETELIPQKTGYVVVEEYDNWYIRLPSDWTEEILYIEWEDNNYRSLDYDESIDAWRWPSPKRNRKLSRSRSTAGILQFYRKDIGGRFIPIKPKLFILAGSLFEHEYPLLLDRLGQLAISAQAAMIAPVAGPLPAGTQPGGDTSIVAPYVLLAKSLLAFFKIFREQWPIIQKNPILDVTKQNKYIRVERGATQGAAAIRQITRRPGATYILAPTLFENADTPENRFLVFALNRLETETYFVSSLLNSQADFILAEAETHEPDRRIPQAYNLWRQSRATAQLSAERLKALAAELTEISEWAEKTLIDPLLKGVTGKKSLRPSLKLTRRPGYQVIFRAFTKAFVEERKGSDLNDLQIGLMERRVKPTAELYEQWVFLETYALLVEKFGFQPVDDQPALHLRLQNGQVILEKNVWYELVLTLKNQPSEIYRIKIAYEPKIPRPICDENKRCFYSSPICSRLSCFTRDSSKYRTPDVVLIAEHNGQTYKFALDAKYRRYKIQGEDEFKEDLLQVAKENYKQGLDFDAVFIVHSDGTDKEFVYFGEEPFPTPPRREGLIKPGHLFYASHEYGAIYAAPGKTKHLGKVLECFLMYHARWYDICWTCRKKLEPKTALYRVGKYYQCDLGHDFWVQTHCTSPQHHLIIKMGWDSFHKNKAEWNCQCPVCGDKLQ